LVGNSALCKVRMNSSRVSAIHCSLVRTGGGLLMVDLNSREGVMVNGSAVRAALLAPGDAVDIGGRRLQMRYDRPAPARHTEDAVQFDPTELVGPGPVRAAPAAEPDPAAF